MTGKPWTLAGGIPFAAFNRAEAEEIVDTLPLISEYVKDAPLYIRDGLSLAQYVDSRLIDKVGHRPGRMSESLTSALDKQDAVLRSHVVAFAPQSS